MTKSSKAIWDLLRAQASLYYQQLVYTKCKLIFRTVPNILFVFYSASTEDQQHIVTVF